MSTTLHAPQGKSSKRLNSGAPFRRDFIVKSGDGLLLGFILPGTSRQEIVESVTSRKNSWLQIATNGTVTLTIGSPEMGPNSFPTLARVLAEQLGVDSSAIKTVQRGPSLVGHSSAAIRNNCWKLRGVGAVARNMLLRSAMEANCDRDASNYSTKKGVITHLQSRKRYTYGQVAAAAAALSLPGNGPITEDTNQESLAKTVPSCGVPVPTSALTGLSPVLGGSSYETLSAKSRSGAQFIPQTQNSGALAGSLLHA